ncbi:MAG: DUF922 domain-containing protein [Emticicia sp.]|uniref:DUF922 domain-containing protein n=1 Tax=Emticicia sp. TaxID=1930953 RepID=UPI003BA4436B
MKIIKVLLLVLTLGQEAYSQKLLTLNPEKVSFKPSFNIVDVVDARPQRENIGQAFVSAAQKDPINFKAGTETAIKRFLTQSLPNKEAQLLLRYRILDLKISESKLPNGNFSGQIQLKVAFDRIGKKDTVLLTETSTSTTFVRSDIQMPNAKYESILSSLLGKSLEYFDKWLTLNGSKHEALIKGVKIIFMPENDANDNDTIYHHTRKVNWDDFRGKPTNTRYGAAIFANFAYGASFQVIDNYIVAKISTKTYMVRGMSWMQPNALSDYALAHEQLHFDIAKVITERFKKKILAMQADLIIDLNSMIQYEYLESYREMNQLQKQYDNETNHSISRQNQAAWEAKVRRWLNEFGN